MTPFIPIDDIFHHVKSIFPADIKAIKRNHNMAHGKMLIVKFALENYFKMCEQSNFSLGNVDDLANVYKNIVNHMEKALNLLKEIRCPSIKHIFCEIVYVLMKVKSDFIGDKNDIEIFEPLTVFVQQQIDEILTKRKYIRMSEGDFSESEYNKVLIKIYLKNLQKLPTEKLLENFLGFMQTFLKNMDNLNQDDVSIYQKIFSRMSMLWSEKLSAEFTKISDVSSADANQKFQDCIISIMLNIITKNQSLIPLTKYFSEIFYEIIKTEKSSNPKNIEKVNELIEYSYKNYPQNLELMKDLIPLIGIIFKRSSPKVLPTTSVEILDYYSMPDQKNDLRFACARALKHIYTSLEDILKEDANKFLICFNALLKLITDEVNIIRNKTCHIVYSNSESIHNDNFSVEFLLDNFVKIILSVSEIMKKEEGEGSVTKKLEFQKKIGDF